MAALTWAKVLGWRMRRQLLDPAGGTSGRAGVVDVVRTMGAIPAWPDLAAELGVGARRTQGKQGDAAAALADNRLVNVYAFGGATHLMTPDGAGDLLAVRASSRMWELKSWQDYYELRPEDWPAFREYVRGALADGSLTRSELAAALGRSKRYRHLQPLIADGNDTLLKPLTWQGDMGFGPPRDGEHTFSRLDGVPGWGGVPDPDEAGPRVIADHLRLHGPTTAERLHDRFGGGLGGRRKAVAGWLARLEDRLETISIEGEQVLVLAEDVADLRAASPSGAVRLLPGRDPYVMAPSTKDTHVVPPAHRDVVSRTANPVISRGAVAGTWKVRREQLEVTWFADSGRVPRTALDDEAVRLAGFFDRPLDLTVD